jgi:hypothetical protein
MTPPIRTPLPIEESRFFSHFEETKEMPMLGGGEGNLDDVTPMLYPAPRDRQTGSYLTDTSAAIFLQQVEDGVTAKLF